jgi:hypothetical protein
MKKQSVMLTVSDITFAAATAAHALSGAMTIATPVAGTLPADTGDQLAERVTAAVAKFRLINSAVNDADFRSKIAAIDPAIIDGVQQIVVDPSMFTAESDSTSDIFSGELSLLTMYDRANQSVVQALGWYGQYEDQLDQLSVQDEEERHDLMQLIGDFEKQVSAVEYDLQLIGKIATDSLYLQQSFDKVKQTEMATA